MLGLLGGFVEELRKAGIPVSMVEAIDAASALRHVDFRARDQVKATLGATLVKNARHHEAFETAFETYFALLRPAPGSREAEMREGADSVAIAGESGGGVGGEGDVEDLMAALFAALRDGNDALLQAVVRAAVGRLAGMEPGRPVGGAYYLYRVLRGLDLDELPDRLLEEAPDGAPLERRLLEEEISVRLEEFRQAVRAEIRRRLVADRGPEAVARTLRRPLIEDLDLTAATREQLVKIEQVVHPLGRKLAERLARRRRLGDVGRLDVRRTVRRSLSTGGVPVDPRFRRPRPHRPRLVLLCDISGSVATFARFTMQLVSAVSSQFGRVRSFAFIDTVDEVSRYFEPGLDFGEAMRRIGTEAEVVWLDGHSDYGNAFGAFAERYLDDVGPRPTVVVTGDARNNYHDPNIAAFRQIAERARALFWLNPEGHRYWDTGDSVMGAYSPLCDEVHEVKNLRQLSRFVERVALPVVRPVRRIG